VKLEALREAHPGVEVELWAEDEARLGLKPVTRRVWAPVGETHGPLQAGLQMDLPLRLRPSPHGRVFWMIVPTVNAELFSLALEEFAREV
jgi:hypothetical protein